MKTLLFKRPSTYLILLALVMLGLGFIMAYYVNITVENLKYDASIINETGTIRGSIQRVAKLVLSGSNQSPDEIIININQLLERFILMEQEPRHKDSEDRVLRGVEDLKVLWDNLEDSLVEYQKTHSEQTKKEIIERSENCWQAADAVVLTAQLANEDKVAGINLFYIILILNALSAILVILLVFSYVRKKLEHESSHDPLTNIPNRRSYEKGIDSEIARSRRYNHPLSLIIFDIDHFKDINDKYGHKAGDRVLIDLARVVAKSIRRNDAVFRVGGEEFAIISPETTADGALKLAEKVRIGVGHHSFAIVNKVTISSGVATSDQDISKDELYHRADQALYLAKNKGRNRTEVFNKGGTPF